MTEPPTERKMHCECGSDTYHLKWDYAGRQWAVCSECGRPTGTIGVGREKQQEWYSEESDE